MKSPVVRKPNDGKTKDEKISERNKKSAIVVIMLVSYLISLALYTSKLHVDTSNMAGEGGGAFGVDMDVALLPLLFPSSRNAGDRRCLQEEVDLETWIPHIQRRQKYVKKILETVPMEVQNKPVRIPGGHEATICKEKLGAYGENITILDELMEFIPEKDQEMKAKDPTIIDGEQGTIPPAKSSKYKRLNGTKHAIVIPFRDRDFHLLNFQKYMSSYLQHHYGEGRTNHTFKLYIIDQDDAEPFQRGFLMNAALDHLDMDVSCVTMHDVDLVPIFFSPVPYHECPSPTRLVNKMQTYDWKIPYDHYFGGIVNLHQQHWAVINGMGNQFRGWGAEDDELYTRLLHRGLVDCKYGNPAAPKHPDHGTFMAISQEKEHHHARVKGPDYYRNCDIMDRHKWAGVSNSIIDGWSLNKYEVTSHTIQYTAEDPILKGFEEVHKIRVVNRIEWLTKGWKPQSAQLLPKKPKTTKKNDANKKRSSATTSGVPSGHSANAFDREASASNAEAPTKTKTFVARKQRSDKQETGSMDNSVV
jgi:hypothetical protein